MRPTCHGQPRRFPHTASRAPATQVTRYVTLVTALVLRAPNWAKIFHVHIDASAFAIGCILTQPGEKNMDFPISYASRQLNSAEKNYTTTEREGLSMIYAS